MGQEIVERGEFTKQSLGTREKRINDPLGTYESEAELSDVDEADSIAPTWDKREREGLRIFAGLPPALAAM